MAWQREALCRLGGDVRYFKRDDCYVAWIEDYDDNKVEESDEECRCCVAEDIIQSARASVRGYPHVLYYSLVFFFFFPFIFISISVLIDPINHRSIDPAMTPDTPTLFLLLLFLSTRPHALLSFIHPFTPVPVLHFVHFVYYYAR